MIIMIRWENLFLCSDKTWTRRVLWTTPLTILQTYSRVLRMLLLCIYYRTASFGLLWLLLRFEGKETIWIFCSVGTIHLTSQEDVVVVVHSHCLESTTISAASSSSSSIASIWIAYSKPHINGWLIRQAKPVKLKVSKRRVKIVLFYQKIMSRRGR